MEDKNYGDHQLMFGDCLGDEASSLCNRLSRENNETTYWVEHYELR
jgi:hypothetical protein